MYLSTLFDTPSQCYYAGQLWAYNRIRFALGLATYPYVDFTAIESAVAEYQ